jgi:hypothetical protein
MNYERDGVARFVNLESDLLEAALAKSSDHSIEDVLGKINLSEY